MNELKLERIDIASDAMQYALRNLSIARVAIVGSSYIADKLDTDVDIIVVGNIKSDGTNCDELERDGWVYGGSDKGGDGWAAFKKTVNGVLVNLIVVDNEDYFQAWELAAKVCRTAFLAGYDLPRELVHAIHSVVMDEGDILNELYRRGVLSYEQVCKSRY